MKDSQPAWALSDKDETNNGGAVERLITRSAPKPKRLLEFFAGLGGVTKRIKALYPDLPFEAWDTDSRCVQELSKIPGVTVVQGDSLDNCWAEEGDGVLMDFNLWTLRKAKGQYFSDMRRIFSAKPAWVQVADSSSGKLHLNYKSYGMKTSAWEEYSQLVDEWVRGLGYHLADQERSHHKTVMLLFLPNEKTRLVRPG